MTARRPPTTARRTLGAALILTVALIGPAAAAKAQGAIEGVPRYRHIVVIIEENKDYGQIMDPAMAPNIAQLAKAYGVATRFYGEVHPSEGNYVALLGGDTFGIHDDDAVYCKAGTVDKTCPGAGQAGYPDHTVTEPHLGDQLAAVGMTWKGYYEDLPAPGSMAYVFDPHAYVSDPHPENAAHPLAYYAQKHSGFLTFASTQNDPDRAKHIVGFDQLAADLVADALPSFALIVPNQCNEMHGLHGPGTPADCDILQTGPLIKRGDAEIIQLVDRLQATAAWKSKDNMAIVITFDEGSPGSRLGCCAVTPDAPSNFGGGHIPTLVITNHGPRGVADATQYNHYSLLRTFEDAFGITTHLRHAGDAALGVKAMTPLFKAP